MKVKLIFSNGPEDDSEGIFDFNRNGVDVIHNNISGNCTEQQIEEALHILETQRTYGLYEDNEKIRSN